MVNFLVGAQIEFLGALITTSIILLQIRRLLVFLLLLKLMKENGGTRGEAFHRFSTLAESLANLVKVQFISKCVKWMSVVRSCNMMILLI